MCNPAVAVRAAQLHDCDAIYQVHVSSIREQCAKCYNETEISKWAGRQDPSRYQTFIKYQEIFVAESQGCVIGFGHIACIDVTGTMEIEGLYVSPQSVGKGVGRLLIRQMEDIARQKTCSVICVRATLNSVGFYTHCGFEAIEETVHCVGDGTELKCLRMKKLLEIAS